MPRLSAETIELSESEREQLEQLLRRAKTPQQIALRAKIILRAAVGESHGKIASSLGISREMSRLWRRRWLLLTSKEVPVVARLQDAPRPGSPATFSKQADYTIICNSLRPAREISPPNQSLECERISLGNDPARNCGIN